MALVFLCTSINLTYAFNINYAKILKTKELEKALDKVTTCLQSKSTFIIKNRTQDYRLIVLYLQITSRTSSMAFTAPWSLGGVSFGLVRGRWSELMATNTHTRIHTYSYLHKILSLIYALTYA